jgi:outer membrane lipoprotein SlyB
LTVPFETIITGSIAIASPGYVMSEYLTGSGTLGGMVCGGIIGLLGGPTGVLLGGLLGGLIGI